MPSATSTDWSSTSSARAGELEKWTQRLSRSTTSPDALEESRATSLLSPSSSGMPRHTLTATRPSALAFVPSNASGSTRVAVAPRGRPAGRDRGGSRRDWPARADCGSRAGTASRCRAPSPPRRASRLAARGGRVVGDRVALLRRRLDQRIDARRLLLSGERGGLLALASAAQRRRLVRRCLRLRGGSAAQLGLGRRRALVRSPCRIEDRERASTRFRQPDPRRPRGRSPRTRSRASNRPRRRRAGTSARCRRSRGRRSGSPSAARRPGTYPALLGQHRHHAQVAAPARCRRRRRSGSASRSSVCAGVLLGLAPVDRQLYAAVARAPFLGAVAGDRLAVAAAPRGDRIRPQVEQSAAAARPPSARAPRRAPGCRR